MTKDDELIRRWDALAKIDLYRNDWADAYDAIADVPAAPMPPEVLALVEKAKGVVQRWDSPDWKSGHTMDFIEALRATLAAWEARNA